MKRPLLHILPPAPEQPPQGPQSDPRSYEDFFGLQERPFDATFDPRFLFHCEAHDVVVQKLLNAVRRRDGVVVLTGPPGIGKTTVCRAVIDLVDRRTLASLLLDPIASSEDLLRTLLVDFGVIADDVLAGGKTVRPSRGDLSAALRRFLFSLSRVKACALLVVDEAQALPLEVLQQLRALGDTENGQRLLQVVLVGQPELSDILARAELRDLSQRVTNRLELGPLDASEIYLYLAHRLSAAGAEPLPEFTEGALARMMAYTAGVPRLVNQLADHVLASAHARGSNRVEVEDVSTATDALQWPGLPRETHWLRRWAVFVLVFLLAVSGAAYGFREELGARVREWVEMPVPPRPPAAPPVTLPVPYAPVTPASSTISLPGEI